MTVGLEQRLSELFSAVLLAAVVHSHEHTFNQLSDVLRPDSFRFCVSFS